MLQVDNVVNYFKFMFDDLKSPSSQADNSEQGDEQKNKPAGGEETDIPTAPKQQVEDMFAETDKTHGAHSGLEAEQGEHSVKPSVFQPKSPASSEDIVSGENKSEGADQLSAEGSRGIKHIIKKYTVLGIIALSGIVILSGGWYAYNKFFAARGSLVPKDNISKTQTPESNKIITKQQNSAKDVKENKQAVKPITKPSDKDHDGLSDAEEAKLGTNPNNVDTDGDGLFDREEVKVYKTDPLNPDTDGDGFSDGDEVKNGYNPNGPGKLYKIKK